MELKLLLNKVKLREIIGDSKREVLSVCQHSKKAKKDALFFSLERDLKSATAHAKEVVKNGGCVIVTERKLEVDVCQVIVFDIKDAMAQICKNFYGDPEEDMRIIALVGTNGKTSTCHILADIFKADGYSVGVMGTIGTYYCGVKRDSSLTTYDTVDLYGQINDMARVGVEVLIMELSAHAISQRRAEGLFFDGIIFTNCTEDHLDYFENMQNYKRVKKSVFDKSLCRYMIINSDDELGIDIINSSNGKIITYGIENPADVFAINIEERANGIKFIVNFFDVIFEVETALIGLCNVYNILSACALAGVMGVNLTAILSSLENLKPIAGRAEPICEYNGGRVFIDYAHTPDGLERTLLSMRKICKGKLYCLFGCGGNREKEKRPIMGSISGKITDFTVITSDNPRYEDANEIIKDIERGIKEVSRNYITIKDRKNAIFYALDKIGEGDLLVVCGKGAEEYQEIMGEKISFSDKAVILQRISGKP